MADLAEGTATLGLPLLTNHGGNAIFVADMREAALAAASFLDERLIGPALRGRWVPPAEVGPLAEGLDERLDYIFHVGHVGSTLVARVLGRAASVMALREPAILRAVAQGAFRSDPTLTQNLIRLWSKTFRPAQRTLLKATSFVSEIAAELLRRAGSPKAIFLTASPAAYLATILGGPHSMQESRLLAPSRLTRLERRLGAAVCQVAALTDGELAAMSWASEMCALAEADSEHGAKTVLWLDFDRLLAEPGAALTAAMTHLRGGVNADELARMLASPDFTRYSKAPEHAYDAALRRAVMAQAERQNGEALRQGLAWLDAAARQFAPIRNALELWRKTASISRQNGASA